MGKSVRNRTLRLSPEQIRTLQGRLLVPEKRLSVPDLEGQILHDDLFHAVEYLPERFVDLLILDPPYNLDKSFNGTKFNRMDSVQYRDYLESWFPLLMRLLKPEATVYLCGDWLCSSAGFEVMNKYLFVQNRITWQREKGRGALANWKNCTEDIWFGTMQKEHYCFNLDAVRMRRKVIAPYRTDGKPKDWEDTPDGKFRLTCPSNFWDDISVPYWSMPENTEHPTQKPEKLMAKLILASSNPGDMVFDPFLGSGTTAVTARKLGRCFCGIERELEYCCMALERLDRAEKDSRIQGYSGGVFWERNTAEEQRKKKSVQQELSLFPL